LLSVGNSAGDDAGADPAAEQEGGLRELKALVGHLGNRQANMNKATLTWS